MEKTTEVNVSKSLYTTYTLQRKALVSVQIGFYAQLGSINDKLQIRTNRDKD